ncbi:MAG: DEAD/DEAH box helicase [Oscillospiraceae bacterium]|nr:DEAD/DEAH box helicase [Oscillospiraceae bacterium]
MERKEYVPHQYQQVAIQRIVDDPAIGLFLSPGLGKTSITLTAVNELIYGRWAIRKVLVIAPRKVAEATWSKEAQKWEHLKHLRFSVVLGSEKKRILALNTQADVFIINRENVPWLVDYYQQAWPFDMLVCDESTSFKNPSAKRFKALKLIRRFCKKVVLLTGTPSSKNIGDLWAQVYLLDEGQRLGKTITSFRDCYFNTNTHGGHFTTYSPKETSEKAILDAISDICISLTDDDNLSLPKHIKHEIPVALDEKTKKAYRQFEREMLLELDEENITAQSAAVLTGKLLQFCNGAIYGADRKVNHIHDHKLDSLTELVERLNGESCLVFYSFQHDRDRIAEKLGKKYRLRVYENAQDETDWNNGEIDILLAHPASCAYGLNLQAGGRHVIWFGLNWSFEMNFQGVRRLLRQGSEFDSVVEHFLVAEDGVDEDVMTTIAERESTHNTIMQVLKARIQKIRAEESITHRQGNAHEDKNTKE